MRKLPKRVIKRESGLFYPQVWFLWWHYVWKPCGARWTTKWFNNMDKAVHFLNIAWKAEVPKSVTVVWRGK